MKLSSVTAADAESSDNPATRRCRSVYLPHSIQQQSLASEFLLLTLSMSQTKMQMNYTGKNELFALRKVIETSLDKTLKKSINQENNDISRLRFQANDGDDQYSHETSDLRLQDCPEHCMPIKGSSL
jgi:hypothetical protein